MPTSLWPSPHCSHSQPFSSNGPECTAAQTLPYRDIHALTSTRALAYTHTHIPHTTYTYTLAIIVRNPVECTQDT
ncbi:hypothetical protein X777_12655 [Ooceraea biroi]|uniref:Uncharacterized protein n=1 Tax=Ooceraea biroi TaxID=2015173 RepID=A0A026VZ56_OOCBI|nr:hypothetical protein X777_12655 [Ooceraea biroi]